MYNFFAMKPHIFVAIKYLWMVLCLLCIGAMDMSAQQLLSYRNKAEGGYNFWFYSPEKPDEKPVPMRPEDKELQWRMYMEQLYHSADTYDWLHWREKQKAEAEHSDTKPLIVFLHGASLCGTDIRKVLRYGTLDALDRGLQLDAYVLAPQNPGGAWNPDKLISLVEWAARTYPQIDTARVYVLGMSLGGYGTLDFSAAYPHRIAAAMAICGGATTKNIAHLRDLPLWILHGTADEAVPVNCSDRVVAAMKRGGKPERLIYTRLKGYNHGQPARIFYMEETYDWLFEHRLTDEGRPVNKEISIGTHNIPQAYRSLRGTGHVRPAGTREVHAYGNLDALAFELEQDSIRRADSIQAFKGHITAGHRK